MAYNHPFISKANYPRLLVFHTSHTEQLQQEQGSVWNGPFHRYGRKKLFSILRTEQDVSEVTRPLPNSPNNDRGLSRKTSRSLSLFAGAISPSCCKQNKHSRLANLATMQSRHNKQQLHTKMQINTRTQDYGSPMSTRRGEI